MLQKLWPILPFRGRPSKTCFIVLLGVSLILAIWSLSSQRIELEKIPGLKPRHPVVIKSRWRDDLRCGSKVEALADGEPVECNPKSSYPCCSALGWCGKTEEHCHCIGCVNWQLVYEQRELNAKESASLANLSEDTSGNKTIVLIVPFRDRERHLLLFKEYWRWFAKHGRTPRTVQKWIIYVAEQFDSELYNKGFSFNAALAVVSGQTSASPDIRPEMTSDFDCIVNQDVDLYPLEGVDYSHCRVPMQLSSELDQWGWKVADIFHAGGIISMKIQHWKQTNGFSNLFFGWGYEDDELGWRLKNAGLLFGDCYPLCDKYPNLKGKYGQSLKRPSKGFGRFTVNNGDGHTPRVINYTILKINEDMALETKKGGSRWKSDGLNNVKFTIVEYHENSSDQETYGITYRHLKIRRGKKPFDIRSVPLAIPPGFCQSSTARVPDEWVIQRLGDSKDSNASFPWDLESLRRRTASLVSSPGDCPGARSANFILIDRRRQEAKIFDSKAERLQWMSVYLRSLGTPAEDGLIVADARPEDEILQAFQRSKAYSGPVHVFCMCSSKWDQGTFKYAIHRNRCVDGWSPVESGQFGAFKEQKPGLKAITWCDNEKYWTQLFVNGSSCPANWAGLNWTHGGTFYTKNGSSFCTGKRRSQQSDRLSFSKLGARMEDCSIDNFSQDLTFDAVELANPVAMEVCIGQDELGEKTRISTMDDCGANNLSRIFHFAAYHPDHASESDRIFCVFQFADGDIIEGPGCNQTAASFLFALPVVSTEAVSPTMAPEFVKSPRVCVGIQRGKNRIMVGVEEKCENFHSILLEFQVPSVLTIAASVPPISDSNTIPLVILVEEEASCYGFLCAHLPRTPC